jgi:hypothetical protein
MKRSEMISKIASVILNHNEPDSMVSREKALDIANVILDTLESKGMKPPVVEIWQDVPNTFLGEGFKIKKQISKWEEE